MSSKLILIILRYTVSKWVHFFETQCSRDIMVRYDVCHCVLFSGVPVQADDAEQTEVGAGWLRGREPCTATEAVLTQVGVHLHAGRGSGQVSINVHIHPTPSYRHLDVPCHSVQPVLCSVNVRHFHKIFHTAISFPHLSTDFFQCHKLVSGPCKDEDPPVHIHCNSLLTVEHILISCVDVLMSFAKFLYSF